MADLSVPRLNGNDAEYVLLEWLVSDGGRVSAGAPVALLETSKAVEELVAPAGGYLRRQLPAGGTCRPGDPVGRLSDEPPDDTGPTRPSPADAQPATGDGPTITRSARELLDQHGIPDERVAALGLRLIRRVDVQRLLDHQTPGGTEVTASAPVALPAWRQRIARTVATSHATVPAAYVVLRVGADAVLAAQRDNPTGFLGLAEFVVHALAPLRPRFPGFFATVGDDLRISYAAESNVAVTMDTGAGLYLPVVRCADELSLIEIAQRLMALRVRALHDRLSESDLAGASITLSLHTQPGVVDARPFVVPGQTCALSLCSVQEELYPDSTGTPRLRQFFHLGAAYDHRVINGREAVDFLTAMRDQLEGRDGAAR